MKIILLDRNAVSSIKAKLAGNKVLQERDRALRLLDKPKNLISPLLSIIEGQTGSRENKEQFGLTLKSETAAIASFFKCAKTDCDFLNNRMDELSDVFSNNIEQKWNSYLAFIVGVQDILHQPIAKKIRSKYRDEIVDIAIKNDVMPSHPIVICALSILYGCSKIINIFKPKPNQTYEQSLASAYNALSDIMVVSRLSMILDVSKSKNYQDQKLSYFTFDKGLEFFLNSIEIKNVYSSQENQNVITFTEMSYKSRLFPDLDTESLEDLRKYLLSRQT